MPKVTTRTFGPGSLESIDLTTWVSKRDGDLRRMAGVIQGSYTVYCGSGWSHEVDIHVSLRGWTTSSDAVGMQLFYANRGEDADDFVSEQVHLELEDWSDPCEDEWDGADLDPLFESEDS